MNPKQTQSNSMHAACCHQSRMPASIEKSFKLVVCLQHAASTLKVLPSTGSTGFSCYYNNTNTHCCSGCLLMLKQQIWIGNKVRKMEETANNSRFNFQTSTRTTMIVQSGTRSFQNVQCTLKINQQKSYFFQKRNLTSESTCSEG